MFGWAEKFFMAWALLGYYVRDISIYLQQMGSIKFIGLYVLVTFFINRKKTNMFNMDSITLHQPT